MVYVETAINWLVTPAWRAFESDDPLKGEDMARWRTIRDSLDRQRYAVGGGGGGGGNNDDDDGDGHHSEPGLEPATTATPTWDTRPPSTYVSELNPRLDDSRQISCEIYVTCLFQTLMGRESLLFTFERDRFVPKHPLSVPGCSARSLSGISQLSVKCGRRLRYLRDYPPTDPGWQAGIRQIVRSAEEFISTETQSLGPGSLLALNQVARRVWRLLTLIPTELIELELDSDKDNPIVGLLQERAQRIYTRGIMTLINGELINSPLEVVTEIVPFVRKTSYWLDVDDTNIGIPRTVLIEALEVFYYQRIGPNSDYPTNKIDPKTPPGLLDGLLLRLKELAENVPEEMEIICEDPLDLELRDWCNHLLYNTPTPIQDGPSERRRSLYSLVHERYTEKNYSYLINAAPEINDYIQRLGGVYLGTTLTTEPQPIPIAGLERIVTAQIMGMYQRIHNHLGRLQKLLVGLQNREAYHFVSTLMAYTHQTVVPNCWRNITTALLQATKGIGSLRELSECHESCLKEIIEHSLIEHGDCQSILNEITFLTELGCEQEENGIHEAISELINSITDATKETELIRDFTLRLNYSNFYL